ncbi:hypothetical protein COOONC_16294 [Cooperia oncophora]
MKEKRTGGTSHQAGRLKNARRISEEGIMNANVLSFEVFVDNFIEVGFCAQSRAFAHAHLTPKNRAEIDRIVKRIRPYHGILLLEDVWPSPDANPSVTLLLKHCEADRSILDMSTASEIPLLQVIELNGPQHRVENWLPLRVL